MVGAKLYGVKPPIRVRFGPIWNVVDAPPSQAKTVPFAEVAEPPQMMLALAAFAWLAQAL